MSTHNYMNEIYQIKVGYQLFIINSKKPQQGSYKARDVDVIRLSKIKFRIAQ